MTKSDSAPKPKEEVMSEAKPKTCGDHYPGARYSNCDEADLSFALSGAWQANHPNAAPKASEAPVEEKRCTYCRQSDPPHLDRECNSTRPAPAPERCPQCKHRPHGTVCFNGESDGDCGCVFGKPAPAPKASEARVERRVDSPMGRAFTSALCAVRYLEGNELKDYDDNHYKKNAVALARGCKVLGDVGKMRRTDRWE